MFPASLSAQDQFDRYRSGSLVAIMRQHEEVARAAGNVGAPNYSVSTIDFPTRARLRYTGTRRPLPPEKIQLLRYWARGTGRDSSRLQMFENEYLFREDTSEVWIAMQRVLEAPLAEEARPGQVITVMVLFAGAYYAGGPILWAFLGNEFDATAK